MISGGGYQGKTETTCEVAASFEDQWLDLHRHLNPAAVSGTRDLHAPVAYVQTPVTATPKSTCQAILDFYGADHKKMTLPQLVHAVRTSLRDHGTRVLLLDDVTRLKMHRADIVELTDSAIDGVRMLLSGHELRVDMPVESIEADVDPDRFQMVVRNLLSNAAKYSPSGTDITVDVRRDHDKALVSVRDEGVGISKEDQSNLFTRFGRIETAAQVQGTGLGLWLSREIARMHEGDLTVESKSGSGSTFTFSVPITH